MVLVRALAASGDENHLLDPGLARFVDRILDKRLVDDRQHLLGEGLGGGEEAGAEARDGEDGLADGFHSFSGQLGLLRRQVEAIVLAFFRTGQQLIDTLRTGDGCRLHQLVGSRRLRRHRGSGRHAVSGRRTQRLAATAGGQQQRGGNKHCQPHRSISSAAFASSIRARTASGAVPPWLILLLTEASTERTSKTDASIRESMPWRSSSESSHSRASRSSASRTARPVIWCA